MSSYHSPFSPSGSAKWLGCSASIAMEKKYENKSTSYSREGTLAHALAEYILTNSLNDNESLKIKEIGGKSIPADMYAPVLEYVETVRSMADGAEYVAYEQKYDLSGVLKLEGESGVADTVIIIGTQLQIHDLKYGKGVAVSAEKNSQLSLYAAGAYYILSMMYDIETIKLVVHQPRLFSVSDYTMTVDDLDNFIRNAREKVKKAKILYDNPECITEGDFNPGEKQCRWCRHRAVCKALGQYNIDKAKDDFDTIFDSDSEWLSEAYRHIPMMQDWIKAVKNEVESRLLSGQEVKDYKIVYGRSSRRWDNEEDVESLLKKLRVKDCYKKELKSPAQIEKMVESNKWEKVKQHIVKSEGKPTVAHVSDKRLSINESIINDFDVIN